MIGNVKRDDQNYRTFLKLLNMGKTDALFMIRDKEEMEGAIGVIEVQQKSFNKQNQSFHKITSE